MPRPESSDGQSRTEVSGSFRGERSSGAQPEIKGVVPTSSISERHDIPQPVNRTTMQVTTVTDYYRHEQTLRVAGWRSPNGFTLVTHPDLVHAMAQKGPAGIDPSQMGDAYVAIRTLKTTSSTPPVPDELYFESRIDYDPKKGLITVYPRNDVIIKIAQHDTVVQDDSELPVNDSPTYIATDVYHEYNQSEFFRTVPALAQTYAKLGFAQRGTHEAIKTSPHPEEYVRRMNLLRETDTESGIYYPRIRLMPAGKIDPDAYLTCYDNGEHPVGAEAFYYFDHDAASDHSVALHIYGEMLMNLLSQYAHVSRKGDEKTKGSSAQNIDTLTGGLGADVIDGECSPFEDGPDIFFDTMLMAIAEDGDVEDLKITEWMKDHKMLYDGAAITGHVLKEGFKSYAKEKWPAKKNVRKV